MRALLALLLVVVVAAYSCDGQGASGDPMVEPDEPPISLPPFRTSSDSLYLRFVAAGDLFKGEEDWAVTYMNESEQATYFWRCPGSLAYPVYDRWTGGSWSLAMAPGVTADGPCESVPVLPGDSLVFISNLLFHGRDFTAISGLPADSVSGQYRMRFRVYDQAYAFNTRALEEDLLAVEERVSNEFQIRIREP